MDALCGAHISHSSFMPEVVIHPNNPAEAFFIDMRERISDDTDTVTPNFVALLTARRLASEKEENIFCSSLVRSMRIVFVGKNGEVLMCVCAERV